MEKVLSNFHVDGEEYYLLANQVGNGQGGLSLTLTNGSGAWKGHISKDDMKSLSEVVNMNLDDFTEQTLNALKQQKMQDLKFQYDVKDSEFNKIFSWKKVMASGEIKYQLGSVKLTAVDNVTEITKELYTFAIDQMKMLTENMKGLEKENERLSKERKKAMQLLESCTAAKIDLENDLYSKFQIIVNDKKAKIRQLQAELKDLKTVNEGKRKQQEDSESSKAESGDHAEDEEEEMDTDEELMSNLKHKSKKLKTDSRLENDSLLLDDAEDEPTTTAGSSRRRIRKTAAKKLPEPGSAVILPKPNQNRTPSTSKTPQLRRKGSSRSNQSDLDADDLFSEL